MKNLADVALACVALGAVARSDSRDARASSGPFRVMDRVTGRPYLALDFATPHLAALALADLLRPYPLGDPWRARLHVDVGVGELVERTASPVVRRRVPVETRRASSAAGGLASGAARRARGVACTVEGCPGWSARRDLCRKHWDARYGSSRTHARGAT